jgi:cytoskeleton protein RodZ
MSTVGDTPGPRLKVERERRGLSAQKAADDMHLDAWVIDALESDNYERIGPAVYAKGHLKKYASLLGLPAEEILAGYAAVAAPRVVAVAPPSVRLRASETVPSKLPWAPIAGCVVAVLVIAGLLWLKPWNPRSAVSSSTAQPVSAAAAAAAAANANAPAPSAGLSAGLSLEPEQALPAVADAPSAAVAVAVAAKPAVAEADAAGSGHARLRLSFSADSWVEVSNAAGQRVFAGYGHANTVKTLAGSAPLRVFLKQAGGVQLEINDRAVAIAPQFVTGNVARFEAGADGVLRRDAHNTREHD